MNYASMLKSSKAVVTKKEKALRKLEVHLEQHPKDYQAKVSSILKKSELSSEIKALSTLEYKAKIQQYREEK